MSKVSEYKKKHRKIRRIEVEPADDGSFISRTHYEPPEVDKQDDRGKGSSIYDYKDLEEKATHKNHHEVARHVKQVLERHNGTQA